MTQNEFEQRTGISLPSEDFEKVNKMYMAIHDIDKDSFCADFKSHSESILIKAFYSQSELLLRKIDGMKQKDINTAHFLIQKSMVGGDQDMIDMAINMIGEKEYILHKIEKGYSFLTFDKELVAKLINN